MSTLADAIFNERGANMKKLIRILVIAALVPSYLKFEKKNGSFETGGLLWSLKKTRGEEGNRYTLTLLPFLKRDSGPYAAEKEQ